MHIDIKIVATVQVSTLKGLLNLKDSYVMLHFDHFVTASSNNNRKKLPSCIIQIW